MRSSTSDVLPSNASTIARIPDPEMKFDSTFRLFSVLLTFNISARACGQGWAGRAGSQTGRGRAPQDSRSSVPLTSRALLEDPTCCAVSLQLGQSALCGGKGVLAATGAFLNMSMLETTAKSHMDKHLRLSQKVTVHTCSCPVTALSVPLLKPAWCNKDAGQHWPCVHSDESLPAMHRVEIFATKIRRERSICLEQEWMLHIQGVLSNSITTIIFIFASLGGQDQK